MNDNNYKLTKEALETLATLFEKIEQNNSEDVQPALNKIVTELASWSIARNKSE